MKPKPPRGLTEVALCRYMKYACFGEHGWDFKLTRHAEHDHPERRFTPADIVVVLAFQPWTLKSTKYRAGAWQYRIKAKSIDGRPITIITTVNMKIKLVKFITKW